MKGPLAIRRMAEQDLPGFFAYLDDHLADNGRDGTPLFQPMPRGQTHYPEDKRAVFSSGLGKPVGEPGWRRAWIALDQEGAIAGHIDLRARPEPATGHRALLGMGVHRDSRRQGLGLRLVDTVLSWAHGELALDWIDLEVVSTNRAARSLYDRVGFTVMGEYRDLFRVDGEKVSYTLMTCALR